MSSKYKRNALPNTYIPVLTKTTFVNILMRLPRQTVVELCNKWPRIVNTQPHVNRSKLTQRQLNKLVISDASKFKDDKTPKKAIIDKMVNEYWCNGLNLLQLSQIDCQLLVDKPNAYSWVSSTVKDSNNKQAMFSLDPKKFLDMLSYDLSTFFMSHIYVCKHPQLPLIILRIQLFDLQAASTAKTSNRPHIISNRAHFVAFPSKSAHIIHSPGNDLVTNIIMQVIERNLPQNRTNLLKVETDVKQVPVKSLESMHVLYGESRFGHSLGSWAAYADDTVDMSPLGKLEDHPVANSKENEPNKRTRDEGNKENEDLQKVQMAANLRFKGSTNGRLKSTKLYEEPFLSATKRRKGARVYTEEDEYDITVENGTGSIFASIAPIQYAQFKLQENYSQFPEFTIDNSSPVAEQQASAITIKLSGSDVFGGLHELAQKETTPEKMIVNPFTMPSWLTGEEGRESGYITQGKFVRDMT